MRHPLPGKSLDFVAAKHVDDIKTGCPPHVLDEFVAALESVFGKGELDITVKNFTCCGVRHISLADASYSMDQEEYIAALKPIENASMTGRPNTQLADSENASLFLSLLMALAFTALSRPDLCVYIVALQRNAQKPTYLHIRRLNAITRWAQRNPLRLTYIAMRCAKKLVCDSDAGFRRETDEDGHTDGRSTRGANYLRVGTDTQGKQAVHFGRLDLWSDQTSGPLHFHR